MPKLTRFPCEPDPHAPKPVRVHQPAPEGVDAAPPEPAPEVAPVADLPEPAIAPDSDAEPAVEPQPDTKGGESSPGSSSSTSSPKPPPNIGKTKTVRRQPARTTGNPSTPHLTGGFSAPSTDGGRMGAPPRTDSAD